MGIHTKLLHTHVFLILVPLLAECGITRRDVTVSPCSGGTFFNSLKKCVSSCEPGFYGNEDTRTCDSCSEQCKTCELQARQCTSCNEPDFLLENSCVQSCGEKFSQGPLTKWARLVGGKSAFEGRLEVFHEGKWGTVCDDGWNLLNSKVVCKELQLGDSLVASVPASSFSDDNLPALIHLDNVQCTGDESNLEMCQHNGWGKHNCGHSEDVGIRCSGPDVSRLCVDSCADGYFEEQGECSLCDETCKTCSNNATNCLQCDEPYFLQGNKCVMNCDIGYYGHMDTRECYRCSEECWNCQDGLTNDVCTSCPEGKYLHEGRCVESCGELNIKHLPIRLVDGHSPYEGRVEVFINNEWGTICDDTWDIHDAQVVCRQLGFGPALSAIRSSGFGQGRGPIVMDRLRCTGEEEELIHCSQADFGDNECFHIEDAGAACAGTSSVASSIFDSSLSGVGNAGATGECVQDCGKGYFLRNRQCHTCDADCLACEGSSDQCTMCKPGRFLQGSSCVSVCPSDRYGNIDSWRCEQCNTVQCERCQDGDRNNICIACNLGKYLSGDSCVVQCPPGLFKSDSRCVEKCPFGQYGKNSLCVPCEHCRTCEAGSNEEVVCTSCEVGKVLDEGQCVFRCSSNKKVAPLNLAEELQESGLSARLVGGRNHMEGRLEVLHANEWGTVCNDHWRHSAGRVACGEMGFGAPQDLLQVGHSSGIPLADPLQIIWLDNVLCSDSHQSIAECTHLQWGNTNCDHSQDVALKCSGPGYMECVDSCPSGYFLDNGECHLCRPNCESCQKVNGRYSCNSCSQDFRLLNQECVLECSPGSLDSGTGHCLDCDASCATCKDSVSSCTSCRENYYLQVDRCVQDCGNDLMLKVTTKVRLQGGSAYSGRVEVLSGENWGTICDDNWSLEEAEVVCRELGLGHAVEAHMESSFGGGTADMDIIFDDMHCNGDEESLFDCGHAGVNNHDCSHEEDAGVTCSGPLVSNKCISTNACNIGYFIEDTYCTKCSTSCRDCDVTPDNCIMCNDGLFLSDGSCVRQCPVHFFGDVDGVCKPCSSECEDCEESASQCTRCPGGQYLDMESQTCQIGCGSFTTRAATEVRLVNGNSPVEGRVEVLYNGEWGTVCDDGWDIDDATVFCRMLGLGHALSAHSRARFQAGNGHIWLDELNCDGTESDWEECRMDIRRVGEHDCEHHEDAGVVCSGPDTAQQCVSQCPDGYYPDDDKLCQQCSQNCETCSEHSEQCSSCHQGLFLKDNGCVETCGVGYFGHVEGECRSCDEKCEDCFDGDVNNRCAKCKPGYFLDGSTCVSACPDGLRSIDDLVNLHGISADRVRLIGGRSDLEGIVQINHNGVWGGICGNIWDRSDAAVVCRELGFRSVDSIMSASQFDIPPDYPTHLHQVQCKGFEYYLSQCNSKLFNEKLPACDLSHSDDAAIRCTEAHFNMDHYTDQRICRKVNDEPCGGDTCYPHVACVNIGVNSSVCMECPDGTFGDGVSCTVAAQTLPEFKLSARGQNRTVESGTSVNFYCAGEGQPAPTVNASNWKKNDLPLPEEDLVSGRIRISFGFLFIGQTRLEDRGTYSCTLTNSEGSRTETSYLTVEEMPSVVKVSPATSHIGGSAILKCIPRGYPIPLIVWKQGDKYLDTSGGKYSAGGDGRLLTISALEHSDEGAYTCVSFNKLGNYSVDVQLTVQEPPQFKAQPTEMEVNESETVMLQCEAAGKPMPSIVWKKDGAPLSFDNERVTKDSTSLWIHSVVYEDMGLYTCVAINDVQVIEASAHVFVIGPPHIRTPPSNKTKQSGETVDLKCDVIGSSNPTVTWQKDGEAVTPDERHILGEEGDLKIKSVEPLDAGLYTCMASNDEGTIKASAYLHVDNPIKYGSTRHVGGSVKIILPLFLIILVIIVVVYLVWKRKSSGKAKYDLFGVRKSSISTSFTPKIYTKPPNGTSQGASKGELKNEQDSALDNILLKDSVDDQEKLVDQGQI